MSAAVKMLKGSGLSQDRMQDLYELYQEDLEEHCEATALDKLEASIRDARAEQDEVAS